jgi:hypothetical protein
MRHQGRCQWLTPVTCNPSYSGGRDQEARGSKPAPQIICGPLSQKSPSHTHTQKAERVAQTVRVPTTRKESRSCQGGRISRTAGEVGKEVQIWSPAHKMREKAFQVQSPAWAKALGWDGEEMGLRRTQGGLEPRWGLYSPGRLGILGRYKGTYIPFLFNHHTLYFLSFF